MDGEATIGASLFLDILANESEKTLAHRTSKGEMNLKGKHHMRPPPPRLLIAIAPIREHMHSLIFWVRDKDLDLELATLYRI